MAFVIPVNSGDIVQASTINGLANGSIFYSPDTGAANAYQVTFNGSGSNLNKLTVLNEGLVITFRAANTNTYVAAPTGGYTGASTLEVLGASGTLGVKPIAKGGGLPLSPNDIRAGQIYTVVYDATNSRFNFMGPQIPTAYGAYTVKDVTQSLPTNTWATQTTSLIRDSGGYWNSATSKLTIPAGLAGRYLITWKATFSANSSGLRYLDVWRNGATLLQETAALIPGIDFGFTLTTIQNLAAGDTIQGACWQNSGSTLTIQLPGTGLALAYLGA